MVFQGVPPSCHPAILPSCHALRLCPFARSKLRTPHVAKLEFLEESVLKHGGSSWEVMGGHGRSWEVMCVFFLMFHHPNHPSCYAKLPVFSLLDGFPMVRWFCTWLFTLFSHVRISIEHGHVERCQLLQKCRCRHSIRLDMGQSWALQNFNVIFIELGASWWLIDLIGNISWSF